MKQVLGRYVSLGELLLHNNSSEENRLKTLLTGRKAGTESHCITTDRHRQCKVNSTPKPQESRGRYTVTSACQEPPLKQDPPGTRCSCWKEKLCHGWTRGACEEKNVLTFFSHPLKSPTGTHCPNLMRSQKAKEPKWWKSPSQSTRQSMRTRRMDPPWMTKSKWPSPTSEWQYLYTNPRILSQGHGPPLAMHLP